jgi:YggT family protein
MPVLIRLVELALQILLWLIFIDVILTWIPSIPSYNPIVVFIRRITRPILNLFRKILLPQRMGDGYIDFSPILAIIAISILLQIVRQL